MFPDEPDAEQFDRIVSWIKAWFEVVPLDAAVDALKTAKLPARAAVITFDDGYADNCTVALPILLKHRIPATFFIATGYLDGGRMWNDTVVEAIRRSRENLLELQLAGRMPETMPIGTNAEKRLAIGKILSQIKYLSFKDREDAARTIADQQGNNLPDNLMMTSEQVITMRGAGMLIGAHTVTHPILAKLSEAEARNEISDCKHSLEALLGEKIRLFAYPNGKPNLDFQIKDVSIIRDLGFDAGVTTAWGTANAQSDLMQLPRFTPWGNGQIAYSARLIRNIASNPQTQFGAERP